MSKKTILRLSAVVLVTVLATGIIWQYFPESSAQKLGKQLKKFGGDSAPAINLDDDSLILLNAASINVKSSEVQAMRKSVGSFDGKRMHLVRFAGAIKPEWFKMMTDTGVEVIDYIPNYTYLVYGD